MKKIFGKIKNFINDKKGSEVVEKIFMIVVSLALAAIAGSWITSVVQNAMQKANESAGDLGTTDEPTVDNPIAGTGATE